MAKSKSYLKIKNFFWGWVDLRIELESFYLENDNSGSNSMGTGFNKVNEILLIKKPDLSSHYFVELATTTNRRYNTGILHDVLIPEATLVIEYLSPKGSTIRRINFHCFEITKVIYLKGASARSDYSDALEQISFTFEKSAYSETAVDSLNVP